MGYTMGGKNGIDTRYNNTITIDHLFVVDVDNAVLAKWTTVQYKSDLNSIHTYLTNAQ